MALYAEMVDKVKAFHQLPDRLAQPPKVIIAQRPGKHSLSQRVLTRGQEVADALNALGFQAQVCRLPSHV